MLLATKSPKLSQCGRVAEVVAYPKAAGNGAFKHAFDQLRAHRSRQGVSIKGRFAVALDVHRRVKFAGLEVIALSTSNSTKAEQFVLNIVSNCVATPRAFTAT